MRKRPVFFFDPRALKCEGRRGLAIPAACQNTLTPSQKRARVATPRYAIPDPGWSAVVPRRGNRCSRTSLPEGY